MIARQILPRIAGEGDRAKRGGGGGTGFHPRHPDSACSQSSRTAHALAPSTASRSPSPVSLRFTVEDFR